MSSTIVRKLRRGLPRQLMLMKEKSPAYPVISNRAPIFKIFKRSI